MAHRFLSRSGKVLIVLVALCLLGFASGCGQPAAAPPAPKPAAPTSAPPLVEKPLPDVLKPLVLSSGPGQPAKVSYQVMVNGDNSVAYLQYQLTGPTTNFGNGTGDPFFNVSIAFYATETRAKDQYQGQLKSELELQKTSPTQGMRNSTQKETKVGDEAALFVKPFENTKTGMYELYIIRQGKSRIWLWRFFDSSKPFMADGLDKLLSELKKLDNAVLFK
jgi:hypothetical protein